MYNFSHSWNARDQDTQNLSQQIMILPEMERNAHYMYAK